MPYESKAERRARLLSESGLGASPIGFPKPLTKVELATVLDTSVRFIEQEVKAGNLRGIRLSNRSMRFMPRDIQAWLDSKATQEVKV